MPDPISDPDSLAAPLRARLAPRLEYLPVSLFGGTMGLLGLSAGWRIAHTVLGAPEAIGATIGLFAVAAFAGLSLAYLVKLVTAPQAVVAEFNHLVAGNLFGTFSISLLLLPLVLVHYSLPLAQDTWIAGVIVMVIFGWAGMTRWISRPHEPGHILPVWVVPVVGLLDVPIALPLLQMPGFHPVAVFGLAIGFAFALPILTLGLGRLIAGPPLPDALQPTLLMLVAPFAVGFSGYVATIGQDDLFADALYMVTLFLLSVLVWRLARVLPGKAFKLGWWGTSFPLAASAIASLRYAAFHPGPVAAGIAAVLLALATLAIAALLLRTLIGLVRGELRTLSA